MSCATDDASLALRLRESSSLAQLDQSWAYELADSKSRAAAFQRMLVILVFVVLRLGTVQIVRPNVRAKRVTTAGRQGPVGENVHRTADRALVACRWRSA